VSTFLIFAGSTLLIALTMLALARLDWNGDDDR
jgi:hypothetical protein